MYQSQQLEEINKALKLCQEMIEYNQAIQDVLSDILLAVREYQASIYELLEEMEPKNE